MFLREWSTNVDIEIFRRMNMTIDLKKLIQVINVSKS